MLRSPAGPPLGTNRNDNKRGVPLQLFNIPMKDTKAKETMPQPSAHPDANPDEREKSLTHLYVLPVLLLEFLALALTRAVLPAVLLHSFKDSVYFVMGCVEFVRGLLAFIMCPLFGKISDVVGRRSCLFITVLGTCAPVCSLAIMPIRDAVNEIQVNTFEDSMTQDSLNAASQNATISMSVASGNEDWMTIDPSVTHHSVDRIWIFVTLLAISGMFSSTFPLTFAYISDTVTKREDRVAAYGLALATFGLSFTIGPMAGGYLARVDKSDTGAHIQHASDDSDGSEDLIPMADPIGQQRVFLCALFLTVLDLLYIYFILPESRNLDSNGRTSGRSALNDDDDDDQSFTSTTSHISSRIKSFKNDIMPQSWSPLDALKVFSGDPVLAEIGKIAFLYYTSLWAVVSTLMLYAAKRFHLSPERLGELMSALGLSTMFAEAVLVRIVVPALGEKKAMRLGLMAFTLQCTLLGVANRSYQLFVCVAISTFANLVYPSLSSLVSSSVAPESVGEALGAINGIKALTEGIGPLFFGTLMTVSEGSALPGWPYLIAAVFSLMAYRQSNYLPDEDDEDYLSEKYNWSANTERIKKKYDQVGKALDRKSLNILDWLGGASRSRGDEARSIMMSEMNQGENRDDELCGLLSEIDEDPTDSSAN